MNKYQVGDRVLMGPSEWQHVVNNNECAIYPDQVVEITDVFRSGNYEIRRVTMPDHWSIAEPRQILGPAFKWDEEIEVRVGLEAKWSLEVFRAYIPKKHAVYVKIKRGSEHSVFRKIRKPEHEERTQNKMNDEEVKEDWEKMSENFEGKKWHFWAGRLAVASSYVVNSSIKDLSNNVAFLDWVLTRYTQEILKVSKK